MTFLVWPFFGCHHPAFEACKILKGGCPTRGDPWFSLRFSREFPKVPYQTSGPLGFPVAPPLDTLPSGKLLLSKVITGFLEGWSACVICSWLHRVMHKLLQQFIWYLYILLNTLYIYILGNNPITSPKSRKKAEALYVRIYIYIHIPFCFSFKHPMNHPVRRIPAKQPELLDKALSSFVPEAGAHIQDLHWIAVVVLLIRSTYSTAPKLGGGFRHLSFSSLFGEMIQFA